MPDSVTIEVSAGRGESVAVKVPSKNLIPAPQRRKTPGLSDPRTAISEAVSAALDAGGVQAGCGGSSGRVCVVVPDKSRTMPVRETLEVLLEELRDRGVPRSRVLVMIATGTHPPMKPAEIEAHVGADVAAAVAVRNHGFREEERLVQAGPDLHLAGERLPVVVNRDVWESDVVIGVGSVRPHRAVGWSGGAKIILPGVAGERTIERWHWLGWGFPREMIHDQVENPMRDAVEQIGDRAGLRAVVNYVMNWRNEPVAVCGGHAVEAHRRAARVAVEEYEIPAAEPADVLILGSPATSTTLYPSVAQLQVAPRLVKQGGTVILLSACADGIAPGLPQVREFGYRPPEEVRELVASGRLTSLVAASHIMYVSEGLFGHDIEAVLVSRALTGEDARRLGLSYEASAAEALADALRRHGSSATVRVVPHRAQSAGGK